MAEWTWADVLQHVSSRDVTKMTSAELCEGIVDAERVRNAMEGYAVRMAGEIERRRLHESDGSLTAGSWLAKRTALASSTARERVRVARGLRAWPSVDAALAAGRISYTHARALIAAAAAHPDDFPAAEAVLLNAAETLPVRALQQVIEHWSHSLDPKAASERALVQHDRRSVRLSQTFDGMWALDGRLDPEAGQQLHNALQVASDHLARECPDARRALPAQRRADALLDLVGHAVAGGDETSMPRSQVVVSCDLAMLEQRAGAQLPRLEGGDLIAPETLRRLACDAHVCRMITDGPSQVLDVGRMTRTVTDPIRRALVARDGTCVFPGCDRPHRWTDAHHLVHWADGGPTSVGNLVLLCRAQHLLVHEGGFRARVDKATGAIEFLAPDGSPVARPDLTNAA
jgi:hypothetical protein